MSRAVDLAVHVVNELRAKGEQVAGINLAFDDSDRAVDMLRAWVGLRKQRQELREYITSIGFLNDERFPPTQAADLLANLIHRYWKANLAGKQDTQLTSKERLIKDHVVELLRYDPCFPLVNRVCVVTAHEMDDAVRHHRRLF
jgi:hypothetical protein